MAVTDKNTIDLAYVDGSEVVLGISDHLPWDADVIGAHWEILQDKLKAYMGFVYSGQFRQSYPDESLTPCIKVFFSYMWPDVVEKYLNKFKELYSEYGCNFVWEFDPEPDEK